MTDRIQAAECPPISERDVLSTMDQNTSVDPLPATRGKNEKLKKNPHEGEGLSDSSSQWPSLHGEPQSEGDGINEGLQNAEQQDINAHLENLTESRFRDMSWQRMQEAGYDSPWDPAPSSSSMSEESILERDRQVGEFIEGTLDVLLESIRGFTVEEGEISV